MRAICKTSVIDFVIEFNDTQAAKDIINGLPIVSTVSTWGDEIYFNIDFKASADGASMDVDIGDVAYWPQGKCLCVFFGPTPASSNQTPVPASPVVIVGKTSSSPEEFRGIQLGEKISINKI
ncbi:MAG: hypothetical protein JW867_07330 [Candidatus Omnitrophica bacterium]|nr:hypothetical protein [Candidatus Omnitrophota bacterium]